MGPTSVNPRLFKAPGIYIERSSHGYYIVWRPNVSVVCPDRKSLLKFVQWPIKTPTGDAIRAWLDEQPEPKAKPAVDIQATGFGPECHLDESDPNHHTRTII